MGSHSISAKLTDSILFNIEQMLVSSSLIADNDEFYSFEVIKKTIISKLKIDNKDHICDDSVGNIKKEFSKNPVELTKQLKILNIVLLTLKSELNYTFTSLSLVLELSNEKPLISKYEYQQGTLSQNLYEWLENELSNPEQKLSTKDHIARVALNLILSEGVQNSDDLCLLISSCQYWFQNEDVFYYQIDNKRQIIGLETVLLLSHIWMFDINTKLLTKQNIIKFINAYLIRKKIIIANERISYRKLNAAYRLENALTTSPLVLSMLNSTPLETQVSHESFIRLLTGHSVVVNAKQKSQLTSHKKWKKLWINKVGETHFDLTKDPIEESLKIIEDFVGKLAGKRTAQLHNREVVLDELKLWISTNENIEKYRAAWMILAWLYKLLTKGSHKKKNLAVKTVKDYIKTVYSVFIPIFSCLKFEDLAIEHWSDKITTLINSLPSKSRQSYIKYFLEFLVESELLSEEIFEYVEIKGSQLNISAQVISIEHGDKLLEALSKINSSISIIARLIFCFGFYAGNRRGEIERLQLGDIIIGDNCITEGIYSRKGDLLKTPNANRNIPLECFWPEHEQQLLRDYYQECLLYKGTKDQLFSQSDLNKAFLLVTSLLQQITGDNTISFHSCRHSFCNWTLLLISLGDKSKEFEHIYVLSNEYLSKDRQHKLKKRLGIDVNVSRKECFALVELLGHYDMNVTQKHYFHLSEFLLLNHKNNYCKDLAKFAKKLFGYATTITNSYPIQVTNNIALLEQINYFSINQVTKNTVTTEQLLSHIEYLSKMDVHQEEKRLSVLQSFNICELLARNYDVERISRDLGVPITMVDSFLTTAKNITNYPVRSSTKLPLNPLSLLSQYKQKNLKKIAELSDSKKLPEIPYIDLDVGLGVIEKISTGKNYQLKTSDQNQLIQLIRIFDEIGFDLERIQIKIYMNISNGHIHNEIQLHKEIEHSVNHLNELSKFILHAFGYALFENIQLVVPKQFIDSFPKRVEFGNMDCYALTPIFSDAKKYINKRERAIYELSVQKKIKKNGRPLMAPIADRTAVILIHLLRIWHDTNKRIA